MQGPRAPNYVAFAMATLLAALGVTAITTKYFSNNERPQIVQTQKGYQQLFVGNKIPKEKLPATVQRMLRFKEMDYNMDHVTLYDFNRNGESDYIVLASQGNNGIFITSIDGKPGGIENGKFMLRTRSRGLDYFVSWSKLNLEDVTEHEGKEIVLIYNADFDGKKTKVLKVFYFDGDEIENIAHITGDGFQILGDINNDRKREIAVLNPYWGGRFREGVHIFSYNHSFRGLYPARYGPADYNLNDQIAKTKNRLLSAFGSSSSSKIPEIRMIAETNPEIFNAALLSILTDPRLNLFFNGKSITSEDLRRELFGMEAVENPLSALSLTNIPTSLPELIGRILIQNYQIAMTYGPTATGPPGSWEDAYQTIKNPSGTTYIGDKPVHYDIIRRYDPSWRPGEAIGEDIKYKILADQEARNARLREAEEIRRANQQTQDTIRRVDEGITNILRPSQPQSPSYPQPAPTPQPYPTGQKAIEEMCKDIKIPFVCPP